MWMSDVHSVGGYLFAASLFALGLAGWQVLDLPARRHRHRHVPDQLGGAAGRGTGRALSPWSVDLSFGVYGANIAAIIRGLIAVAWYGIQTYVASKALIVVVLKFFPEYAVYGMSTSWACRISAGSPS